MKRGEAPRRAGRARAGRRRAQGPDLTPAAACPNAPIPGQRARKHAHEPRAATTQNRTPLCQAPRAATRPARARPARRGAGARVAYSTSRSIDLRELPQVPALLGHVQYGRYLSITLSPKPQALGLSGFSQTTFLALLWMSRRHQARGVVVVVAGVAEDQHRRLAVDRGQDSSARSGGRRGRSSSACRR